MVPNRDCEPMVGNSLASKTEDAALKAAALHLILGGGQGGRDVLLFVDASTIGEYNLRSFGVWKEYVPSF